MDRYWQDVADFLAIRGLTGRGTVGPIELASAVPIDIGYRNARPADGPAVKTLVLHKGRYEELDRRFLTRAIERLHPVFANEVFIVLCADAEPLPDGNPHLGNFREIGIWASSPETVPAPAGPRVSATYLGNDAVLAETIHGHLMVLRAGDRTITPHIIRDGYFDLGLTRFLERFLRPGMVYVDVGANVGVYALLAAWSVGATGRVVAIEPRPRLQPFLIDNFSMNGFLDRVHVLPFAAADRASELTIYEFGHYDGASTVVADVARLLEQRTQEVPRKLTIQSKPLSELLRDVQVHAADLIKIDVEGFEREVLQGARDFLMARPETPLLLEWHPEFMTAEKQGLTYAMLVDELGCHLEAVEGDGSTRPVGFDELCMVAHADLYARRANRADQN